MALKLGGYVVRFDYLDASGLVFSPEAFAEIELKGKTVPIIARFNDDHPVQLGTAELILERDGIWIGAQQIAHDKQATMNFALNLMQHGLVASEPGMKRHDDGSVSIDEISIVPLPAQQDTQS